MCLLLLMFPGFTRSFQSENSSISPVPRHFLQSLILPLVPLLSWTLSIFTHVSGFSHHVPSPLAPAVPDERVRYCSPQEGSFRSCWGKCLSGQPPRPLLVLSHITEDCLTVLGSLSASVRPTRGGDTYSQRCIGKE